ncbi:MAG: SRPBCC family protein [Anaerolineales bacterium]|nr:SRPBCC family protein [Anaerolineales bacterium]
MFTVEKSATINASIDKVWEYLTKTELQGEWRDIERAEEVTDGPFSVGTQVRIVQKFMGREMDMTYEVTEIEEPTRLAGKTDAGPLDARFEYKLRSENGSTHLTITGEGEAGGLFKVAEGLFSNNLEKQLEEDLNRLKDVAGS